VCNLNIIKLLQMRRVQIIPECSPHVADLGGRGRAEFMVSRCAANQSGFLELGRKGTRRNVLHRIGKCWLCFLDVGSRDFI
jgi:hypothetical protein